MCGAVVFRETDMRLHLAFLVLPLLALSGCAVLPRIYAEPERCSEELATVVGGRIGQDAPTPSSRGAQVVKIDGRLLAGATQLGTPPVQALPGEHEVELRLWYMPWMIGETIRESKPQTLIVTLEAGQQYAFLSDLGRPTSDPSESFWDPRTEEATADEWTVRLLRTVLGDDDYREGVPMGTWTSALPEDITYRP
jgi:hypothetical protein